MQQGDEQAGLARQLLAGTFHGVLSTHSLEHDSYPFGSVVPRVLDAEDIDLHATDELYRMELPREVCTADEARSLSTEMAAATPPSDA